jgi:hypothetical protein
VRFGEESEFCVYLAMSNSLISVIVRLGWVRFGELSEFCVNLTISNSLISVMVRLGWVGLVRYASFF